MKRVIYFVSFIFLFSFIFTSCQKEEMGNQEFGLFTKTITITDDSGNNQITLLISSNYSWILNYLDENNFYVVPVQRDQTFKQANDVFIQRHPELLKRKSDEILDGESIAFNVFVVNKSMSDNVKNLAIYFKPPEIISKKSWSYATFYSQKEVDHTFYIYRNSFLRRVYFTLEYKATASSSWSTTIANRKLKYNEEYTKTYSRCYWIKARVKYRRSSDFTLEFEE